MHYNLNINIPTTTRNYTTASNSSWYPSTYVPFCLKIQTISIYNVITYWDLALFIPNFFFFLYLICKWCIVKNKLKSSNFPIFKIFFYLILLISLFSILRCFITLFIKPQNTKIGELINKIAWLIVRFGQLATELSVVLFGLFFSRLDSNKTILKIIYCTIPISLVYITVQGGLELFLPDKHYIVVSNADHYYDVYGHGGMIFWFISSVLFAIIYIFIFLLPYTNLKNKFQIPTKKIFYIYCMILALICIIQSIGSSLIYTNKGDFGMCIVDVTTYLYFTFYGPLVYLVFLRKFFQRRMQFPNSYYKDNESMINRSVNTNDGLSINASETFTHSQITNKLQRSPQQYIPSTSKVNNEYNEYYVDEDDTKVIVVNSLSS